MGERTLFSVQTNRMLCGSARRRGAPGGSECRSPATISALDVEDADEGEQPPRRGEIHLDAVGEALAQQLRGLVVHAPPAHIDGLDLGRIGALEGGVIALAD